MSEMVERVARALCRSKRNRPEGYPDGWMERHINENWRLFEDDAHTAIAAMREPTQQQMNQGYQFLLADSAKNGYGDRTDAVTIAP